MNLYQSERRWNPKVNGFDVAGASLEITGVRRYPMTTTTVMKMKELMKVLTGEDLEELMMKGKRCSLMLLERERSVKDKSDPNNRPEA